MRKPTANTSVNLEPPRERKTTKTPKDQPRRKSKGEKHPGRKHRRSLKVAHKRVGVKYMGHVGWCVQTSPPPARSKSFPLKQQHDGECLRLAAHTDLGAAGLRRCAGREVVCVCVCLCSAAVPGSPAGMQVLDEPLILHSRFVHPAIRPLAQLLQHTIDVLP